jgi:hypothetical protein
MARYDDLTKQFMSDVLLEKTSEEDTHKGEFLTRQGVGIVKDLATSHTPGDLARKIIKRTLAVATKVPELGSHPEGIVKKSGLDLFEYMSNRYEDRWYHWEPETIWQTLEYDGITADEELRNSIQAFQVVTRTNFPFEDWHIFEKTGHAFNNNPVNFGQVQPLELDEIAYTIKILTAIRPQEEFEDDVKAYIAAAAKEAGVVYLPTNLYPEGCQQFLDKMGNEMSLKEQVAKKYPDKGDENSALGVQLARLSEIDNYVKE